ncbi:MAG: hypothetical protein ABI315_02040 [Bacteroidia bacterium]
MNNPYINIKHSLLVSLLFCNTLLLIAQQSVLEGHNVVTVIGDSISKNNLETKNIYETKSIPNGQKKMILGSKNGLSSLGNEFPLRTEIQSNTKNVNASSSSSNNKEYGKIKRRKISIAEHKFNFKKRFRTWIPKPKKKYRPNICGKV